jgi:hypothetical protein
MALLEHVAEKKPTLAALAAKYYLDCVKHCLSVSGGAALAVRAKISGGTLAARGDLSNPRCWNPTPQLRLLCHVINGKSVEGKRVAKEACQLLSRLHTPAVVRPLLEDKSITGVSFTPKEIGRLLADPGARGRPGRGAGKGCGRGRRFGRAGRGRGHRSGFFALGGGDGLGGGDAMAIVRRDDDDGEDVTPSLRTMLRARRLSGASVGVCGSPKVSVASPAKPSPWRGPTADTIEVDLPEEEK